MKKLKLNKLFHWLYAIVMLLPLLNFVFTFPLFWFTGYDRTFWVDDIGLGINQFIEEYIPNFEQGTLISSSIYNLWTYLFLDIFGLRNVSFMLDVVNLFCYWTVVSLAYLVFDVVMLPINIAHHWIDKGSDRL